MDKIYARFVEPNAGFSNDPGKVSKAGLKLGERYLLEDAEVGGWYTRVSLVGISEWFNSVHFDFEDEEGNLVDIYRMPEYITY